VVTLEQTWKRVTRLLEDAATALPPPRRGKGDRDVKSGTLSGSLGEFREFLDHNELELAWDALAAVARESRAGADAWLPLVQAASLMHLERQKDLAIEQFSEAISREPAPYRIVFQRPFHDQKGRTVWRRARRGRTPEGLKPVEE
jgi:hypothetical protein